MIELAQYRPGFPTVTRADLPPYTTGTGAPADVVDMSGGWS